MLIKVFSALLARGSIMKEKKVVPSMIAEPRLSGEHEIPKGNSCVKITIGPGCVILDHRPLTLSCVEGLSNFLSAGPFKERTRKVQEALKQPAKITVVQKTGKNKAEKEICINLYPTDKKPATMLWALPVTNELKIISNNSLWSLVKPKAIFAITGKDHQIVGLSRRERVVLGSGPQKLPIL
jgi:hypothetical protein